MPSYIALLRGVNVSGHHRIKMDRLRATFLELGFRNVRTYFQSGNVVFDSGATATSALGRRIEAQIQRDFGFRVPVIVRTPKEMATVVKHNPFLNATNVDVSRLHVTFLSEPAPGIANEALRRLASGGEQVHVNGRTIYLHCPDGYGGSRLSNTAIERHLRVGATTRNWKTTNALLTMVA